MAAAIPKSALSGCLLILLLTSTGISASQQHTQLRQALPDAQLSITSGAGLNTSKTVPNLNRRRSIQAMNAGIQQLGYLKASNTGPSDWFGISVAISGDTMVVGASLEDSSTIGINNGDGSDNSAPNSGAVYVFSRSGNSWEQQAYLKASNTGAGDEFGYAVAISGDTIIVGAPHEDGNGTGVNLGDQDNNEASSSGAIYVFTRAAGIWTQQAYIKASNAEFNDRFGKSVSISADTLVAGAYLEDSSATSVDGDAADNTAENAGAAYVFTRSGDIWSQSAYLKASNAETTDYFGYAVAISADTIVVGAQNEDSNSTQVNGDQNNNLASFSGAAYVFIRTLNSWEQQSYLKASNTNFSDRFGFSVAISGETIAVGAYLEDSADTGVNGTGVSNSAFSSGAAYAFNRTNTTWTQQAYLKASNTDSSDLFGFSVAVSGDLILVGSRLEDSESTGINQNGNNELADGSGAAYSFIREAGVWQPLAYIKASNTGEGDKFGVAVAASASTMLIGALNEDSSTTGINGDEENDLAPLSGAAYVFSVSNIGQIFIDGFESN